MSAGFAQSSVILKGSGLPSIAQSAPVRGRMKCPDLVADDLSGFWGVPNRGIGMRPEVPRANSVGVMGTGPVQAGALTSAIDRPLPGDHPEMEDFARAGHGELSCRAVVVGAARRQPPVRS